MGPVRTPEKSLFGICLLQVDGELDLAWIFRVFGKTCVEQVFGCSNDSFLRYRCVTKTLDHHCAFPSLPDGPAIA